MSAKANADFIVATCNLVMEEKERIEKQRDALAEALQAIVDQAYRNSAGVAFVQPHVMEQARAALAAAGL